MKVYGRRNGEEKEASYQALFDGQEHYSLKKDTGILDDGKSKLLDGEKESFIRYHKPTSLDNPFFQINFSEEGHYRLSLNYKDPSGNPIEWDRDYGLSEEGLKVTVDKTDPKIYFDPSSESGQVRYFAKDVKFTTKILEENFSTNDTHLNYNFLPDTVKSSPSSLAMPVSPSTMPGRILHPRSLASTRGVQQFKNHTVTWKKEKLSDSNLYSSELNFTEDGQYEVMVDTTDLSGRKASASNFLVVDKTPLRFG